jgi:ABC-type Fe3+ transport system permease subunit
MIGETAPTRLLTAASVVLWAVVIFLPLAVFVTMAVLPAGEVQTGARILPAALRSVTVAAIIAAAAVLFGWVPGRLLGTCRKGGDLLLLLLLMPLVLPRYVLYYAWTLLLSPTTQLGAYLSGKPELARLVGTASSSLVLVLWYWPLAALLIAQGWRSVDRQVWECASLDADRVGIFKRITLPLLARPLMLAFGVCFVLGLSEFATFDLAGVQTIGTELAVLYEETGSESHLARAAWPVVAVALILAVALGKGSRSWGPDAAPIATAGIEPARWQWILLLLLLGISLIAPTALLIGNMTDTRALRQFLKLHPDDLTWSLVTAGVAAAIAYLIAFGALSLESLGSGRARRICRALCFLVRTSIFLVMFVPASIVAVSLLKLLAVSQADSPESP